MFMRVWVFLRSAVICKVDILYMFTIFPKLPSLCIGFWRFLGIKPLSYLSMGLRNIRDRLTRFISWKIPLWGSSQSC